MVDVNRAQRLMTSGNTPTAEDMHAVGITPEALATADKMGLDFSAILTLVAKYGPVIDEILTDLYTILNPPGPGPIVPTEATKEVHKSKETHSSTTPKKDKEK